MLLRWKPRIVLPVLIAIAVMTMLLGKGCRNRARPGDVESERELKGEPEQYAATVVRTVEDGTTRDSSITRESRSGEQRREEWTEQGRSRALIWRPDLGKSYLLDLDRQVYVEIVLADGNESLHVDSHLEDRASADSTSGLVQAVERGLGDAPSPDRVETRMLPVSEIDGYSCRVYEQRATFPDAHTEIIRTFRARDLSGLALRIESESEPASVRTMTERKDVSLEVPTEAFTVPANFKKVDKIER